MKLEYEITKEELKEFLFCLDWKKERRWKQWNAYMVAAIGIISIVQFWKEQQFYWMMLACTSLILVFYLVYGTSLKRMFLTRKMWKAGREFSFMLPEMELSKILISNNNYIFQKKDKSYYIPKRCLSVQEHEKIKEIIENANCKVIELLIRK